ncbi:MAG TPA: MBL fold metallo-hydrolase [Rhodothermales bacterium]|nr:MBL fold metallo-hydrolase [Rhodothermales bacterium]
MKVTLLGTGTSTGIPVIGCQCQVCRSTDPRDKRTRCAAWVQADGMSLIIDTGPDFRVQALREGIDRLDAVLLTHHHFDHIAGLDDLRPYLFDNRNPIPCYARDNTAEVVRNTFWYIFKDRSYPGVANLSLCEIETSFDVESRYGTGASVHVEPVDVYHGELAMYGYRIGRFAYLTDVNRIPEHTYERLRGLDVLVLDALRHEPHLTHFSIDEAVEAARRIGARQTYFVHMTHSVLHAPEDAQLPGGMALAYDGLSFEVPNESPEHRPSALH